MQTPHDLHPPSTHRFVGIAVTARHVPPQDPELGVKPVADGDGVIVVPRGKAAAVAEYAHRILEGDKQGRRALCEKLGMPADDSVK